MARRRPAGAGRYCWRHKLLLEKFGRGGVTGKISEDRYLQAGVGEAVYVPA